MYVKLLFYCIIYTNSVFNMNVLIVYMIFLQKCFGVCQHYAQHQLTTIRKALELDEKVYILYLYNGNILDYIIIILTKFLTILVLP